MKGWLWFLTWCAFFSLAFTRAYWIAEGLLSVALVLGLLVMTAAKLRQLWQYRSDPAMRNAIISSGQGGVFNNSRWRRWALDLDDESDFQDNNR